METRLELRYEADPKNHMQQFVVRHVLVQDPRIQEINDLLKPEYEKLEAILKRLKELDHKRFKFIDQHITAEDYEPYRLEANNLRDEYNLTEEVTKPLETELEPLVAIAKANQEEFDAVKDTLIVTPEQIEPFIPAMKAKYEEAYASLDKLIAEGYFEQMITINGKLQKRPMITLAVAREDIANL